MLSIGIVRTSSDTGYLNKFEGPCGWRNVNLTQLSAWMISITHANHQLSSDIHVTKPVIDSIEGRSVWSNPVLSEGI